MLEHQKKVLIGVAKYPHLFKKELVKSFTWLSVREVRELHSWVRKEFGTYYGSMISEVFCRVSA
jgi:hypothetical protein